MSTTASPVKTERKGTGIQLRNIAIGALFAVVLLVPRLLHVRRNPQAWLLFRIFLGLAGAGLALFLLAALLPGALPDTTTDEKARELGAFVVVNGGRYFPGNAPAAAAQLFVGQEHIWALDSRFQPLVVIPVADMTAARAEQ